MVERLSKPHVLVVEDYPEARQMYAEYLRFSGFRVDEARNGEEALSKAFALLPNVIVMDLALPLIDGWEATRRLKADPRTAQIPIVALTGQALAEHQDRARLAGCSAFLRKPCLPDELVSTIRAVLGEGDATDSQLGGNHGLIAAPTQRPIPALPRRVRVFLCHASPDKSRVRELYERLKTDAFDPWLDEENLLPGQNWQDEIAKAVRTADVVAVCLSAAATTKTGFVQREIKLALDAAEERPEGKIFLVPVRLEECEVPERLRRWQWVNLYDPAGYAKLAAALRVAAFVS
jgi:two-component system cell cycle response regulator DivK